MRILLYRSQTWSSIDSLPTWVNLLTSRPALPACNSRLIRSTFFPTWTYVAPEYALLSFSWIRLGTVSETFSTIYFLYLFFLKSYVKGMVDETLTGGPTMGDRDIESVQWWGILSWPNPWAFFFLHSISTEDWTGHKIRRIDEPDPEGARLLV